MISVTWTFLLILFLLVSELKKGTEIVLRIIDPPIRSEMFSLDCFIIMDDGCRVFLKKTFSKKKFWKKMTGLRARKGLSLMFMPYTYVCCSVKEIHYWV